MSLDKKKALSQLAADIVELNVCPKLAQSAKQLVMGDGNVDADIVFIGEAPGKKEDESGLPFVGASGKSLDQMLASIELERKDVYITNIVKYRPPNNRDPSSKEKQAFAPFLSQQLAIIGPKLVVTLGRHSMEYFLPGAKIGEMHGQKTVVDRTALLPLYHPAAALYNGGLRQTLLDDFGKIPKIISQIN